MALEHGHKNLGESTADCPEHCQGCSELEIYSEKETCSDGFGGHSWTESEITCCLTNSECPANEWECPAYCAGRKPLTEIQFITLEHIKYKIENDGFPPSIREIAEDFGITTKAAYDRLKAIEKKGY